jgi:glycine cleavage system transcriptional repressor
MKKRFYFLTVVGSDRPGLVADVSGILVLYGCNLEDSSMMRLGSEFGIFVIFTAPTKLPLEKIKQEKTLKSLFVDIKPISSQDASFRKTKNDLWIVRVHGADQSGLVHSVTQCLAGHGFNITDLSTHRTSAGRVAGYALFIEGEPAAGSTKKLKFALDKLASKLETHISFEPVAAATL